MMNSKAKQKIKKSRLQETDAMRRSVDKILNPEEKMFPKFQLFSQHTLRIRAKGNILGRGVSEQCSHFCKGCNNIVTVIFVIQYTRKKLGYE